jgi:hypothetical protein
MENEVMSGLEVDSETHSWNDEAKGMLQMPKEKPNVMPVPKRFAQEFLVDLDSI